MRLRLRPFGFLTWIAPRHPLQVVFLVTGLLLAYAHAQLQMLAIQATLRLVDAFFQVEIHVGHADVDLFRGLVVLEPVRAHIRGQPVLEAERMEAAFLLDWSNRRLEVERIEFLHPLLQLERRPDGSWNFGELVDAKALDERQQITPQSFPRIVTRGGRVVLTSPKLESPLTFDQVDLEVTRDDAQALRLAGHCSLRAQDLPGSAGRDHLEFHARLLPGPRWTGRVVAQLVKGDVRTLRPLVGHALDRLQGDLDATLTAEGPLASFETNLDARFDLTDARLHVGRGGTLTSDALELTLSVRPGSLPEGAIRAPSLSWITPEGCELQGHRLRGRVVRGEAGLEVQDAQVQVASGALGGRGLIRLVPTPRGRFELRGDGLQAAAFACLLDLPGARLDGPLDVPTWTWDESADTRDLRVDLVSSRLVATLGQPAAPRPAVLGRAHARLVATTSSLDLVAFESTENGARLSGSGSLWRRGKAGLDLTATLAGLPLGDLPLALPASSWTTHAQLVGGSLSAEAKVRGGRGWHEIGGRLAMTTTTLTVFPEAPGLTLAGFQGPFTWRRTLGERPRLAFPALTGFLQSAPTTAQVEWVGADVQGEVSIAELPLPEVLAALGREHFGLKGRLGATTRWRHQAGHTTAQSHLRAHHLPLRPGGELLGLQETVLEDVALDVAYQDGDVPVMTITRGTAAAFGGHLDLVGAVQLGAVPALELEVAGRRLELGSVSAMVARTEAQFSGLAEVSGHLEGPLDSPRLVARVVWEKPVLATRFGDKDVHAYPDRLDGTLRLTPAQVHVGPLTGDLAGGPFELEVDVTLSDPARPWRLRLNATDVDLSGFVAPYLTGIEADVFGKLAASALVYGKGANPSDVSAGGQFTLHGGIRRLGPLDAAQERFQLRNLRDIELREVRATLGATSGRLHFRDIAVETSHGSARGDVELGLGGDLGGTIQVALDRMVLRSRHRLLSELEGGDYFQFRLELGGTLSKPDYGFRSRAGVGAVMTGAALFSPLAVPAAVFMGLKNLLHGSRRPRTLDSPVPATGDPAPESSDPTESSPAPPNASPERAR